MKKDFKNNLIHKIKKEKLQPISRNFFLCKTIGIYIFLIASIFIWAVSFAIVFAYLFEADWFLTHKFGLLKVTINFLPLFWLAFLSISTLLSYFNFKNTPRGYKFYLWQIFLWNIVSSVVFWVLFYISGFSQIIEYKIQSYLPQYRSFLVWDRDSRMKEIWQNEEEWLLLWEVTEKIGINWGFIDSNEKTWIIYISEGTNIKHNIILQRWMKVKIIGKKISENTFESFEIRPFTWKRREYR